MHANKYKFSNLKSILLALVQNKNSLHCKSDSKYLCLNLTCVITYHTRECRIRLHLHSLRQEINDAIKTKKYLNDMKSIVLPNDNVLYLCTKRSYCAFSKYNTL